MIFISSTCLKKNKIHDSVREIANAGFKNVELSGGSSYYDGFLDDLMELKEKYSLNYRLHNYLPPQKKNFILNLSALNTSLYKASLDHCLDAIRISKLFNASELGFHAGFLIDIKEEEFGKKINRRKIVDKNEAISQYHNAWIQMEEEAENKVKLFIENNVFSYQNFLNYKNTNPFLLTHYSAYIELNKKFDFNLLLDLAHLKVSCNSLDIPFTQSSIIRTSPLFSILFLSI